MFLLTHISKLIIGQHPLDVLAKWLKNLKLPQSLIYRIATWPIRIERVDAEGWRHTCLSKDKTKPKSILINILPKMSNTGIQAREIICAQCLNNGCFNVMDNREGQEVGQNAAAATAAAAHYDAVTQYIM